MSGIVGILNTDGAPIDRELLGEMTDALRFRGPDAARTWIDGHVGFGHTLFATTEEAWTEKQPCTLDNDVWMVADVRVDGREDLIRRLEARGRANLKTANDADLLLHAYAVWGTECVDHLLGEFAFAIWDRRERRLFCARDQFGAKPFYYAFRGNAFVFSNTLNAVRMHPQVSDALNEQTIADFLLVCYNQSRETTAFADIQRLPGGHTLTLRGGQPEVRRYWSLPEYGEIRYRRSSEYVEHFKDVLSVAVKDRLRTRRASVLMSGGLDSSGVAAFAREHLSSGGGKFELHAHTLVYDRLIPDQERHYAGLVAEHLGIPISFVAGDDHLPCARRADPDMRTPEPVDEPYLGMIFEHYRNAAACGRVALTGSDGDTLLHEVPARHFAGLAHAGRYGQLAGALAKYAWTFRTVPPVGFRTMLQRRTSAHEPGPELPSWVDAGFAARWDLAARWRGSNQPPRPTPTIRPRARWVLTSPQWAYLFESRDPGVTGIQLEIRHPMTDLRFVEYMLSIPAVPWCMRKMILREAMRGVLPEAVRRRTKSPLAGDPVARHLDNPAVSQQLDGMAPATAMTRFVNCTPLPSVAGHRSSHSVYLMLRLLSLNYWLNNLSPVNPARIGVEDGQEQAQPIG